MSKRAPRSAVLAVYTPHIGSEMATFVEKHIRRLLPGRTVVITEEESMTYGSPWKTGCPTLLIGSLGRAEKKKAVRDFLSSHRVTHVLAENLDHSLEIWRIVRGMGIAFFVHAHGRDVSSSLRQKRYRKGYLEYNASAGVITVSRYQKRLLIGCGIAPAKIHVIPCGVDLQAPTRRARARKPVRCIAVGRMEPTKAPLLLLKSFQKALRINPDLQLEYFGSGSLWAQVERYVLANHLQPFVRLRGVLPNSRILKALRGSEIFLQHSVVPRGSGKEEGLPVSILEAMAAGLPVVSTRHAGIPEAVLHGRTGLLCGEGEVATMARDIARLAASLELRHRMGRAGKARATRLFSWASERERLLELFFG